MYLTLPVLTRTVWCT